MLSDAKTKLDNARNYLKELGEAIDSLETSYPDIFNAPEVRSLLDLFRQAHRVATHRLATPRLCVATLGTTSSGKSTIVNALIGRKIAPIEAGEMSGGVLTLQDSDENKIIVDATEGAEWYTGEQTGLSDEELYELICNGVMNPYHATRKKKACMAPQVKVFCSLLPASNPNLLALPAGVGVEFIDLPGLKSVQDRANLAVIQEQVPKAFSIVALDYAQVDDDHRKRLLEELKRVVQYLQGRTDSMLFILNRVDLRGNDDIPISERINQLQGEIQQVLSLGHPPDVLPFSAQLLYYAQCAWGATPLESPSSIAQSTRLKLLDAMLKDCAKLIRQQTDEERDLRHWIRNLEDRVLDGEDISDETMRQVLRYALEWSGGAQLWNQLRVRVQESFSELIILPALVEIFDSYDALAKAVETLAEIRKIESKEVVDAELARISESRQRLNGSIQSLRQEFGTYTEENIEGLKKNDPTIRSRLAQRAKEKGRKGFQELFVAVDAVEGDLTQKLISPVRDALKNKQEVYPLEENLSEVTTPVLAKDIAGAYDSVSRRLIGFTPESGDTVVKRIREDSKEGKRELEVAERAVRKLYQVMREGLSTRAEFTLQAQAQKFEEALQGLVDEQEKELSTLCTQELPSLKLDEAIMSAFRQNVSQSLPTLPEKFFELPSAIEQRVTKKEEVVGQRQETENYTTGTCYKQQKTRTISRDIKGEIVYCELSLPNADMMARQWAEGIAQGKERLWDILCVWIIERLNFATSVFDKSVNDVIGLAERVLQEQKTIIEQNFEAELQRWREIEVKKASATIVRQKLEDISRTSHVAKSDELP